MPKETKDFKAVEFMRQIRSELTSLYHKDKKKYLDELKRSLEEFKIRQKRVYS